MQKRKYYYNTRFSPHVIEEAHNLFQSKLDEKQKSKAPNDLTVHIGNESLHFDINFHGFTPVVLTVTGCARPGLRPGSATSHGLTPGGLLML